MIHSSSTNLSPLPTPVIAMRAPIDLQDVPSHFKKALDAQPGAHILVVNNTSVVPYLIHYVAHCLASGKGLQGIPFPALPTTILVSSTKRGVYETAHLASKLRFAPTYQTRTLHQISELPIELHHHETLELLKHYIAGNSHVIVQHDSSYDMPHTHEALARLDRVAHTAGTHVMLIGVDNKKVMKSKRHPASEHFYADHAEEDPHCHLAWSMGSSDLEYRNFFGDGRVLVQVKAGDGGLHIEQAPFISNKLIDRVVYKCHRSGLTMAETGVVVGRDKGTISRILQTLPRPLKAKLPDKWWEVYVKTFNFTNKILAKLEKSDR